MEAESRSDCREDSDCLPLYFHGNMNVLAQSHFRHQFRSTFVIEGLPSEGNPKVQDTDRKAVTAFPRYQLRCKVFSLRKAQ